MCTCVSVCVYIYIYIHIDQSKIVQYNATYYTLKHTI